MRAWFTKLTRSIGPNSHKHKVASAWKSIQHGNGTIDDFEVVLADLVAMTGYYRRPSYGEWIKRTKTPHGFETHSALSNARAEVVQHIMDYLTLDAAAMVALDRASRAEHGR